MLVCNDFPKKAGINQPAINEAEVRRKVTIGIFQFAIILKFSDWQSVRATSKRITKPSGMILELDFFLIEIKSAMVRKITNPNSAAPASPPTNNGIAKRGKLTINRNVAGPGKADFICVRIPNATSKIKIKLM